MSRRIHLWASLLLGVLFTISAVSGLILATQPLAEHLRAPIANENVVQVTTRVVSQISGIERIRQTPSGELRVDLDTGDSLRVDPLTGKAIAVLQPSNIQQWFRSLHRELFAGNIGRLAIGLSALGMLLISISGLILLIRKQGGWYRLLCLKSTERGVARWHSEISRLVLPGLLLLSMTGVYLSCASLGLVSDGTELEAEYPETSIQAPRADIATLSALQNLNMAELRELEFPIYEEDAFYTLRTASGEGYINAASGELISFLPHNTERRLYELIFRLHTGASGSWLTLYLGLTALSVPLLMVTGLFIWWRRQRQAFKSSGNVPLELADTLILVGSQSNSTWGYAGKLHEQLCLAGFSVHIAAMNDLRKYYAKAERILVLTSTYGDGQAPDSAKNFLSLLNDSHLDTSLQFAVLGFGDSQFRHFCGYASQVNSALFDQGLQPLLAMHTVDRGSSSDFSKWGNALSEVLGIALHLEHNHPLPQEAEPMQLVSRQLYGERTETPAVVLRFQPSHAHFPAYEPGDLVAISPGKGETPRLYSIASSHDDGFLEICVRKHSHGLCSTYLHDLSLGESVIASVQPHPGFRPDAGQHPIILVGVGTGIGPLVGFIRKNHRHRPIHLFWGGRNQESDFLYETELNEYLADGRLAQLHVAFSEGEDKAFVQDRIHDDARQLQILLANGAQILICGSRQMADGVQAVLDRILTPVNMSVALLRTEGRYREDVFG